ncbi:MAG: ATP-binding cassette domain-containing protein [Candidatus Caldarchaeum sp.]|uniref:ATP-binding cassette domain-containing protein n=1 Tax=Caldiarchaeum subterraneum TaxID=311458 RepID=A0A7C5YB82_CALS0
MKRLLTIRGLSFSYDGRRKILDGVNLDLHAGESLAIMGYSGSGKTTLLKIIAGLLYPYEGIVEVTADRGGIGYIPQNVGLVKNLTALQNVLHGSLGRVGVLAGMVSKFPAEEVEKAYRLLGEMGLADVADRKAGLLSGGERQRVAVARSLMQSPSILLADEFVSDLDIINAIEVMTLTNKICKRNNIALLMTMHDVQLVNKFADRVAVLKDGRITADMPAGQIDVNTLATILTGGTMR